MKGTTGAMGLKLFIATLTPPRTQEGLSLTLKYGRNEPMGFESCPMKLALKFES